MLYARIHSVVQLSFTVLRPLRLNHSGVEADGIVRALVDDDGPTMRAFLWKDDASSAANRTSSSSFVNNQ